MEEIRLEQGDQVPDGAGDFVRVQGAQALLQRVLFRLSAKRGAFPFLPRLGSQLHRLARESAGDRQALCEQYVRQALEDEIAALYTKWETLAAELEEARG